MLFSTVGLTVEVDVTDAALYQQRNGFSRILKKHIQAIKQPAEANHTTSRRKSGNITWCLLWEFFRPRLEGEKQRQE